MAECTPENLGIGDVVDMKLVECQQASVPDQTVDGGREVVSRLSGKYTMKGIKKGQLMPPTGKAGGSRRHRSIDQRTLATSDFAPDKDASTVRTWPACIMAVRQGG